MLRKNELEPPVVLKYGLPPPPPSPSRMYNQRGTSRYAHTGLLPGLGLGRGGGGGLVTFFLGGGGWMYSLQTVCLAVCQYVCVQFV